jgi:hypothetical protein
VGSPTPCSAGASRTACTRSCLVAKLPGLGEFQLHWAWLNWWRNDAFHLSAIAPALYIVKLAQPAEREKQFEVSTCGTPDDPGENMTLRVQIVVSIKDEVKQDQEQLLWSLIAMLTRVTGGLSNKVDAIVQQALSSICNPLSADVIRADHTSDPFTERLNERIHAIAEHEFGKIGLGLCVDANVVKIDDDAKATAGEGARAIEAELAALKRGGASQAAIDDYVRRRPLGGGNGSKGGPSVLITEPGANGDAPPLTPDRHSNRPTGGRGRRKP